MAYHNNPKITNRGLICCIDLKDTKSYSGSGSTITDRSGNNNHFTINGANYNSEGYLNFVDNNGDYIVCDNDLIGGLDIVSFDMWIRLDAIGGTIPLISYATSGNANELLIASTSSTNIRLFKATNQVNETVDSNIWNVGGWVNFSFIRNGTNVYFYINGNLEYTITYFSGTFVSGGAFILGQEQDSVEGGFDTTQDFVGDISIFRAYNVELTAEEVLNNYNSHKSRFVF